MTIMDALAIWCAVSFVLGAFIAAANWNQPKDD